LTGNLGEPRDLQCAPASAQSSPFRQFSHRIVILRVCNFIGFAKKLTLKTKSLGASKIAKKINKITGSERSA
jgi:hypothetical protein